jgi:formylglycine-generating enzyme required for sulfatase activity
MALIRGTAKNVEFAQVGAISRLLKNNSVLFSVALDEPFILSDGRSLQLVPVRLDCFQRVPSFDDLKVEVVGEYDDFDGVFRGDVVDVESLGVRLNGAKYLSLLSAIVWVVAYILLIYFLVFMQQKLSASPSSISWQLVAAAFSLIFLLIVVAGALYLKRVAVVVIAEKGDRLLRRITEWRPPSGKSVGIVERDKTVTRRVYRIVNAVLLFIILLTGLAWITKSYWERAFYRFAHFRPHVLSLKAERMLQPLSTFRECANDCPEMVVVPPGGFTMGSPADEAGRGDDEGPQRQVTIAKPFAVAKFDVTRADWNACVSVGGCPEVLDGPFWGGENIPVTNISWDDAKLYVAWLCEMTGKPYRLLSEAEWEYAARAGSTTAYYWGDTIGEDNANCNECGNSESWVGISPVGSLKPNAFGLYDMAGNVAQWVEDCSHDNYDGAPPDGSAWTSGNCSMRGVRGGGFDAPATQLRSASRDWGSVADRDRMSRGFRVGRTLNRE